MNSELEDGYYPSIKGYGLASVLAARRTLRMTGSLLAGLLLLAGALPGIPENSWKFRRFLQQFPEFLGFAGTQISILKNAGPLGYKCKLCILDSEPQTLKPKSPTLNPKEKGQVC